MIYWSAYIRSDSFHLFTCVCGSGDRGSNIRVDKQNSQCSCRRDMLPSHKRSGWEVFPSQPPQPRGMCLPFDACFDALISSFAAYILLMFGWRCTLMKRGRKIWGLKKKSNTWKQVISKSSDVCETLREMKKKNPIFSGVGFFLSSKCCPLPPRIPH